MTGELPRAIGLIRRDIYGEGVDVYRVAEKYGFRIVWTVRLDTGPLASALILSGAVMEHGAAAVVVPSFGHADAVRHAITDVAALVTPVRGRDPLRKAHVRGHMSGTREGEKPEIECCSEGRKFRNVLE